VDDRVIAGAAVATVVPAGMRARWSRR
jgi:hypothetical protein